MAKNTRRYRRLRQPPILNKGYVRVAKTCISLPFEYAVYIGRPGHVDLLVDDETRALLIIASDERAGRTLHCRAKRFRCYIDIAAEERPLLKRGLYTPITEHDRVVKERVIKLVDAIL